MTRTSTDTLPKPVPPHPLAHFQAEPSRAELRRYFASHPLNDLIVISNHAVERYRKRFRPNLDLDESRIEMYASMRAQGQFTPLPPQWLYFLKSTKRLTKRNIGYMVINDEIAMPLRANTPRKSQGSKRERPYIAVTCLYRLAS